MSRIVWDKPEERKFEAGVSKGVLYVDGGEGVPWNGLVSIQDSLSGADVESRYQDGVKTHNYVPPQEFETEITALTYPDEFERCLGFYEAIDGVFVDEQPRVPFGMTYQTLVGDAVVGTQRGYRIHLIYNAIATPNQILRTTIGSETSPTEFSWGVKTAPIEAPGFRPASHFSLDPTRMGPRMFKHICDRLYGAPGIPPQLLTPRDILEIVEDWQVLYPSNTTYPSLETLPGGP